MNREASTWARHLLAACHQNARRMATDPRQVQHRVAEALTSILLDEGLVATTPDFAITPINNYTEYYLGLHSIDLDSESIEFALSKSSDEAAENIFEGLFKLAEDLSKLIEVRS